MASSRRFKKNVEMVFKPSNRIKIKFDAAPNLTMQRAQSLTSIYGVDGSTIRYRLRLEKVIQFKGGMRIRLILCGSMYVPFSWVSDIL